MQKNQKINTINFLLDGKKTFAKEKSEQRTKKLKAIYNKPNEIEAYKEKLKIIMKNENVIF